MIRGVNKQIIEVNETENEYFDRAILFVKAAKSNVGVNKLQSEASMLLNGMTLSAKAKKAAQIRRIALIVGSAVLSSILTLLILAAMGGLAL